jgi:phosphate transport system substrate-binding protein
MRKKSALILLAMITALSFIFAGCSDNSNKTANSPSASPSASGSPSSSNFDTSKEIAVVSREEGSGTRGAFIELFGVEEKGADGTKKDNTTKDAEIQKSTGAAMTSVASNPYAIGYISLGSLNDTVKALKIDGAEATVANIKSGTYKISRPFNIATKGEATGLAKDFIDFILSKEGQDIVEAEKFIKVSDDAAAFAGTKPSGKIVVGGSSSVTPVMEKLKEAYIKLNPSAQIEVQQNDSSSGMKGAIDGTFDIGMASRELKDSELASLTGIQIAIDGVAVVVNPANTAEGLTAAQVKDIFTGAVTEWSAVLK